MFFEVKLTVEKEVPCKPSKAGATACELKQVNEHYICECENALEAYYKANELYNNKCEVYSIAISKIKEIVNTKTNEKPFFKATIVDILIDDAGEEKEQKSSVLVCAKDVNEATRIMEDYLKQGYSMGLIGINRVKILDLI